MKQLSPFGAFLKAFALRVTLLTLLISLPAISTAQAQGNPPSRQLQQTETVSHWPSKAKRWALVIGVDVYKDGQISPLKGSANDARTLADALIRYAGFPQDQVILMSTDQPEERQPTRVNILRRLSNLASVVPKDGLLLVSFAGHGMERNGQAYLLPSDAQISNDITFLEETAVSVARVKERIRATGVNQVVVLLDACRNDPGGRADAPNPLTAAYTKFNFDVRNHEVQAFATIYATAVGQRAYEYTEKRQGYFTWSIVEGIKGGAANEKGEVTLASLVKYVQENVPKQIGIDLGTGKQQRPFAIIEGYKADDLIISVAGQVAPMTSNITSAPPADSANMEISFWESIKNSTDPSDFQAYLERFPNGTFAPLARRRAQASVPANSSPGTDSSTSAPRLTGTIEGSLAQAERDYQDKDYNKVIALSSNILSSQPDNARANLLLGLGYLQAGKYTNSANYLSRAIALGEKVNVPIQHHHYVFLKGDDLCTGYVTFGENTFEFHSTSQGGHDFSVPVNRVYEVVVEQLHGGRLRVKVGIQKDAKEDRKTYNFHLTKAFVSRKVGSSVNEVFCDNCLNDVQAMSQLFQQLIKASEAKGPASGAASSAAPSSNQSETDSRPESPAQSNATTDHDQILRELLDIEHQGLEAINRGDKAAISALMADEFTQVENGKTYDKAKLLSAIKPQKYALSLNYESTNLSFQGEIAVLDGIAVLRAQNQSAMVTIREKFTDQFVKRNGKWLMLSSQIAILK
jgi:tetratricopeptide (TPR) repeat protein